MEKSEIREILKFMKNMYPGMKQVTTDMVNDWHDFIGEYESSIVKVAIKNIAAKKPYIPNVGEILLELGESFKITTLKTYSSFVVFVDFHNSRYPFTFADKDNANNFIDYLKNKPSRRSIEEKFVLHIQEKKYLLEEEAVIRNENYKRRKIAL